MYNNTYEFMILCYTTTATATKHKKGQMQYEFQKRYAHKKNDPYFQVSIL